MKKLIILFFVVLAFVGCSKKDDPAPDAATAVSGTYKMSKLTSGGQTISLPITDPTTKKTYSGIVTAVRKTATSVNITVTFQETGVADDSQELGDVELSKNGSSYDMMSSNVKVGTIDGKTFNLDVTDGTDRTVIIASK